MLAKELLANMKSFLEGEIEADDFSFDFPARLAYVTAELDNENPKLSELLNAEMPETCANFEPNDDERNTDPDFFLSEQQMREKTKKVYERALKLM